MTATTLTTTNFNNSSDANFRTWGLAVHNAILAGGWINTADSGQIDFATVLAPAAINTSQGYKMYRSNDAGGGLDEYFVKLEFGSGAVSLTRPAFWLNAGWATDGAGNLITFPTYGRTQVTGSATPAGASIGLNIASGSGYLCFGATSSLAFESIFWSLERTRDTALAFKNQILVLQSFNGGFSAGGAGIIKVFDKLNGYASASGGNPSNAFAIPPNANSPIAGRAGLGVIFGQAPGNTSPSINVFGVEDTALGAYQNVLTIPILAVNHNYIIQRDITFGGQASTVLLTRYE